LELTTLRHGGGMKLYIFPPDTTARIVIGSPEGISEVLALRSLPAEGVCSFSLP
jgi:hypothetical protein